MKQERALSILKTGKSVFLTGEPGSGKTHVTRAYVDYLREREVAVAVTASTGIAATHLNGLTIHSWSGIGVKKSLEKRDLKLLKGKKWLANRVKRAKVLVIDEISMIDGRTLDLVDEALRAVRENGYVFGGLQVVMVGDFFQLPPVTRKSEGTRGFAFEANAWQELDPVVCYLGEQYRQSEVEFLELLASLRRGECDQRVRSVLESRVGEAGGEGQVTRLYSHNRDVDRINAEYLARIDKEEREYEMEASGPGPLVEGLARGCMSPELLRLKEGAKVMFTKNNFDEGFVNGTIGEVVGFGEEERPVVVTKSGLEIEVEKMEWRVEDGERVLAKIEQLPLRLAWAITVHKSQGMSLDEAEVDLRQAFEYGQGYVALSRVRTLNGLRLLGFNQRSLEVHPEILAKDWELRDLSSKTTRMFERLDKGDLLEWHKRFVINSGGRWAGEKKENKRGTKSTYDETHELFEKGMDVAGIARERGYTRSTILRHLERLILDGRIAKAELAKILPDKLKKHVSEIRRAFGELGMERLSPVYYKLNKKYSYSDLRLVRMVI